MDNFRKIFYYSLTIKDKEQEILEINGKIKYLKEKIAESLNSRNVERENIAKEICTKLKELTENIPHRLLNIYRIYNSNEKLTNSELDFYNKNIADKLPQLNDIRTRNDTNNKICINIPIPCKNFGSVTKCLLPDEIINDGIIDLKNNLVDIPLNLTNIGNYLYPLDENESVSIIEQLKEMNLEIPNNTRFQEYDKLLEDYEKTLINTKRIYENTLVRLDQIDPKYFGNIIPVTLININGKENKGIYNIYSDVINIFKDLINGNEKILLEYYPVFQGKNIGNLFDSNLLHLLKAHNFNTDNIIIKFNFTNSYEYNSIIFSLKHKKRNDYEEMLFNMLQNNINNVKSYAHFHIGDKLIQLPVYATVTSLLYDLLENFPDDFKNKDGIPKFPSIVLKSENKNEENNAFSLIDFINKDIDYLIKHVNNNIKLIGLINPYDLTLEFFRIGELAINFIIDKLFEKVDKNDPYLDEIIEMLQKIYNYKKDLKLMESDEELLENEEDLYIEED